MPPVTWPWAITQLLPSPGLTVGLDDGATAYAMRWQLTPLLYSWGVRREVVPWRVLVAEPLVRYGGSLELFVAGEYVGRGGFADRWGVRSGARVYLPLQQRGENAALSLGASHVYAAGAHDLGVELGGYVLYGVLGLQVTFTPPVLHDRSGLLVFLSVRYF